MSGTTIPKITHEGCNTPVDSLIDALTTSKRDLIDRLADVTGERDTYRTMAVQAIRALHDVIAERDRLRRRVRELLEDRRTFTGQGGGVNQATPTFGNELHSFERLGDCRYVLGVPEMTADFEVNHVHRERYQLHADITVYCGIAGTKTHNGILFSANFNLSSRRRSRSASGSPTGWNRACSRACAPRRTRAITASFTTIC